MSDAAAAPSDQGTPPDLAQMIMTVDEPVWKKISTALKVKTREEAVQLVQQDQNAAAMVLQIVKSKTALSEGAPASQPTALTQGINVPSAAERIYGGGKAKLQY